MTGRRKGKRRRMPRMKQKRKWGWLAGVRPAGKDNRQCALLRAALRNSAVDSDGDEVA